MSIEVGSKLQGKVTGITHFGAFVELADGSTGLVHISEVADSYVKDINDYLKIGDEVKVKVINVEKDGKIGLSIKKAVEKPEKGHRGDSRGYRTRPGKSGNHRSVDESFELKMAKFLKESEERLSSLRRHTESKRGGRGARRG